MIPHAGRGSVYDADHTILNSDIVMVEGNGGIAFVGTMEHCEAWMHKNGIVPLEDTVIPIADWNARNGRGSSRVPLPDMHLRHRSVGDSEHVDSVISANKWYRIGKGDNCDLVVPDTEMSNEHVDVCWDGCTAHVHIVEGARTPILAGGGRSNEVYIPSGEWFIVGKTYFEVRLQP